MVGDYISREAAIRALQPTHAPAINEVLASVLRRVPAADVVPVVRCKDCRHRDPEDKKCDSGAFERAGCLFPVDDDYFCADGKRKDGGQDDGSDPEPPKEGE